MATGASYNNTEVAFYVQCNNKMCTGIVMVSLFFFFMIHTNAKQVYTLYICLVLLLQELSYSIHYSIVSFRNDVLLLMRPILLVHYYKRLSGGFY